MATHSSTLTWKIPWTQEPGRLQYMGSLRVGHDWATSLSLFTFMYWRRKWQPTPVFLPGKSQGRGTWWAAISGVTQSRTRLKRPSSSRSSFLLCLLYGDFFFFFLNHKWVLNFVKSYLCIYWNYHMGFIFQFVNMVYHHVSFVYIEEFLLPCGKVHLIMMYDPLNVFLGSIC